MEAAQELAVGRHAAEAVLVGAVVVALEGEELAVAVDE